MAIPETAEGPESLGDKKRSAAPSTEARERLSEAEDRTARRAAALRENLRKRKEQQRARQGKAD
jgi:hypothetical protein